MKLSKFIEQSLALGFVPFLEFKDKDSFNTGVSEQRVSPKDKNPIQVLQNEIRFFKSLKLRIETKEGIEIKSKEAELRLQELYNDLTLKITEFEKAIEKLST